MVTLPCHFPSTPGALDYLLKPFDNKSFDLALSRAKERLAQAKNISHGKQRLAIKASRQILFFDVADIDWIEAADYYVCLHVRGKTHLLRRSIASLEHELDAEQFCRIHRSTIVNLQQVSRLALDEQGNREVVLRDGSRLRLSERHRRQFDLRLGLRNRRGAAAR